MPDDTTIAFPATRLGRTLLPLALASGLLALLATHLGDSPDAGPYARPPVAGELRRQLALLAMGAAGLLLVIRPWTYRRHWGRALLALVLWTPWTVAIFTAAPTRGSAVADAHFAWAMLMWLGLGAAAVVSGVAHRRGRTPR